MYWAHLAESACLTSSCFDGCARNVWHGGETQANEQHDEDEATEESEPSSGDEDHALGQGDALALVAWTRACRQLRAILGRGQGNFHLQAAYKQFGIHWAAENHRSWRGQNDLVF